MTVERLYIHMTSRDLVVCRVFCRVSLHFRIIAGRIRVDGQAVTRAGAAAALELVVRAFYSVAGVSRRLFFVNV